MRTVAALYVLARGPYADMPGVDPWPESRDATLYRGRDPVVAHPPCAHYTRLSHLTGSSQGQSAAYAPFAAYQVRRWGGILEQPAGSRLWPLMGLPRPDAYRQFPLFGPERDAWGGWTLEVDQSGWKHPGGHKATWLYFVGIDPRVVILPPPAPKPQIPAHWVDTVAGWKPRPARHPPRQVRSDPAALTLPLVPVVEDGAEMIPGRRAGARCAMDAIGSTARKRSPEAFAVWLVDLARTTTQPVPT